jgi:AcrR family transcriptional regulator
VPRELTVRGAETRTQLERHGTRLFVKQGYHGTSVDQIVDSVGVGKGVFYWYFPSKEQFFASLVQGAWRDLRSLQEVVIGEEVDALRRIEIYVRATIAWTAENSERAQLFTVAGSDLRLRSLLDEGRKEAVTYVQRHLDAGMEAGQIPRGDSLMLAVAIRSVLIGLVGEFKDHRTPSEIADATVAFVLPALRSGTLREAEGSRRGTTVADPHPGPSSRSGST